MCGRTWTKTSSVSHGELNSLKFNFAHILIQLAKKCYIVHAPESDHSAVSLVFQSNHLYQNRGPGFRKFNTAFLKDEVYVTARKVKFPIFKEKYNRTHDLGFKWDLIKMDIRGFTIKYSKGKVKRYRDEEKLLHKNYLNFKLVRKITRTTETSYSSFNVLDLVSKKSCWRKPKAQF